MDKADLNKLKNEIINEKANRAGGTHLVESMPNSGKPRDEFLNGLITSLHSGRETAASSMIKEVGNKVAIKNGEQPTQRINERQAPVPTQRQPTVGMSQDRDEQLFADLEKKKQMSNKTLAESIEGYTTGNGMPQQPTTNYNGANYLNSVPQQPQQQGLQLNEAHLAESVKELVNGHLSQNLGPIFEEAIKGTIIEMYAVEQIKKVLDENRDLIKSVVIETIRDIQAKNKKK